MIIHQYNLVFYKFRWTKLGWSEDINDLIYLHKTRIKQPKNPKEPPDGLIFIMSAISGVANFAQANETNH